MAIDYASIADRVIDKLDELGQFERGDIDDKDLHAIIAAIAEIIQSGVEGNKLRDQYRDRKQNDR